VRIAVTSVRADPLAASGAVGASGQGRHIGEWAASLARRGHDVRVYARRVDATGPVRVLHADGFEVIYLTAGPVQPLPPDPTSVLAEFAGGLARHWATGAPEVVHTHFWLGALAGLAASRGSDIRTVHTFHTLATQGDSYPPDERRLRMERAIARSVDHVVATHSAEIAELTRLSVPRLSVSVIPPGVDVELFASRGDLRLHEGRTRVVAVGRLLPRKGFDVLLRAVAAVPNLEVVIAGAPEAGASGGLRERDRLVSLARQLRISDRVVFRGALPRAEVPLLLHSADVVVCPSRFEPFGLVAVEAMACGVPVIATAVGGHVDSVVDGVTGRLVPPDDPGALAGMLRRVLSDGHERLTMSRAAVDRARSRYSWDRIAEETERLYARVCGQGPIDIDPTTADLIVDEPVDA
jgi:D-inositol-3-phosphate glycosyltransferase